MAMIKDIDWTTQQLKRQFNTRGADSLGWNILRTNTVNFTYTPNIPARLRLTPPTFEELVREMLSAYSDRSVTLDPIGKNGVHMARISRTTPDAISISYIYNAPTHNIDNAGIIMDFTDIDLQQNIGVLDNAAIYAKFPIGEYPGLDSPGDTWVDEASAFMDHFFAQYYHRLKKAGWPTLPGCTALPEDHPWLNFHYPSPDPKTAHVTFEGGGLDRAYTLLDAIDKTPFCATYNSDENGIQEFTASDCAPDAPALEADHWVIRIDPDTNVNYADVRNAFRTVFERLIQS